MAMVDAATRAAVVWNGMLYKDSYESDRRYLQKRTHKVRRRLSLTAIQESLENAEERQPIAAAIVSTTPAEHVVGTSPTYLRDMIQMLKNDQKRVI